MLLQELIIGDWKPIKKNVEIDDSAYSTGFLSGFLEGKKMGFKEAMDKLANLHGKNIQQTASFAEAVSKELENNFSISCSKMYLNIDCFGKYTVMLLIDIDTYTSDKRLKAYEYLINYTKQNRRPLYYLDFSFLYQDGELNEELLACDGFKLCLDGSSKSRES